MENKNRISNIFESDDEKSDNADTEVSQILETLQTPMLEKGYVLEEDNEMNSNKEREDYVEKLKDHSKPQKKMKKNYIGSLIKHSIAKREQRAKERLIERQKLVRKSVKD